MYFWVGTDGSMIPVYQDGSTGWGAASKEQAFGGSSAAAAEFVPGPDQASPEKAEEGNFKIGTPTDCRSPVAVRKPSPVDGEDSAEIFVSKESPDIRVIGRR